MKLFLKPALEKSLYDKTDLDGVGVTSQELSPKVKPVLSSHSKIRPKLVFNPNYCLMQVKNSAILSTFIKPPFVIEISFCLLLSGRLRQVLLYISTQGRFCIASSL